MDRDFEQLVRMACFEAIRERQEMHGDVLPVDVIQESVRVAGSGIALFQLQSGIHKPRQLDAALSVMTSPVRHGREPPYADGFGSGGLLHYHYRDARTDSDRARLAARRDNDAVRSAQQAQLPIIYWFGVVPGRYKPFFPVHVVTDDPDTRRFGLDLTGLVVPGDIDLAAESPAREYRTAVVRARMHQAQFREAVMKAYRRCCAVCRLKRAELVEAAHIVADADGGEPVVPNGLALCKLHHAAFDRQILGIRPDLKVVIRTDVLEEVDGPMLLHGLQDFHEQSLFVVPSRRADRPDPELLERRWERFQAG